jgi:predicted oxidoreductase (fatty acid repression mutant protein)
MNTLYWDAVRGRRTCYAISKEPVTSDGRIEDIVADALRHAPSAFNSQSARAVLLLGEHHNRLWDLTKAELKKRVSPEQFEATAEKIDGAFRSGYGSVLFFEDMGVVQGLQQGFPAYSDNFPIWSHHSSGMLQHIVWTALELDGWGASLQHYNPVIDEAVREAWQIPSSWKLVAQMPFGKPVAEPGPKEFLPLEQRMMVFK